MTGAGPCAQIRLELGVYVLGVIGSADRSVVDAHLSCCADCRGELAELAGLPGLLSRAIPDEGHGFVPHRDDSCGSRHEPSTNLGPRCLRGHAVRLRGHRMWPRMAAAAGICPIDGAGVAGASGRHEALLHPTCRAIMGKQGGDSAR
jgi:anti-sigma factor RsiW